MGLGKFPIWRIIRKTDGLKRRDTWNEVGLYLLQEMVRRVSLTLKSVVGALFLVLLVCWLWLLWSQ